METSLPLATDSFSYSWLPNCKPLANDLKEPLRESTYNSCEGTTNYPLMEEWQNFNFDISITQSPAVLSHADELFSNGLIKPLFAVPSTLESCNTTTNSTQSKPISSFSSRIVSPRTVQIHHGFLTKWKTSTYRTLRNLYRYVNQLCQKVGSSRKSTKVDDIDKEEWLVNNSWSSSQQPSPKSNTVNPIGALLDHENSIYEAVLHCKRSIVNTVSNKGRNHCSSKVQD